MQYIYEKYVDAAVNDQGQLENIRINPTANFNFAYDVVDALGVQKPQKRAMLWVSKHGEERDFSFGDMMDQSSRAANYFRSLGIGKGDVVMLVLKRHYQFWFALLGLHKLGAVAVPATHQLKTKDFVYRFNAAGVKAIVCTGEDGVPRAVEQALPDCPTVGIKCLCGRRPGWEDFDAGLARSAPVFPRPQGGEDVSNDDISLMYFTSGTTGHPKITAHSYTYPLGHVVTAKWWHNVDPEGLHFAVADTGWGKAVWGKLYGQWLCEAAVFTYDFDRFDADALLAMVEKYRITTFCAPPTIYRFMIREDLSRYDLSCLKHATIAGEALNPEVFTRFYEATGLKLMEGFGQTETTVCIANLVGTEPRPGSMGKPTPQYDVELLTAEGLPAGPMEPGEIVLGTGCGKPVGLFTSYYRDEDRTGQVWHDGYYHTGDMALRDADGYFWFVGRSDDVIKSSGYRIGPFEIESVLMEHPAVLECAVTGVPDPVRGQAVKATIVLARGYMPCEALRREIQEYAKAGTAPYKYPRVVEFTDELPKTISGKIRRVALRSRVGS